jgi:hypothetical protein
MAEPFRTKHSAYTTNSIEGNGSLVIGGDLDTDAAAYIQAVETADGQSLEGAVRLAYAEFVVGCKSDGIWDAIKASCIMAGARTLAGALVPLKGAAPTNFNFVSGDYDRKTGLKGDGATKYLDSNRADDTDPQDSKHIGAQITERPPSGFSCFLGVGTDAGQSQIFQRTATDDFGVRINGTSSFLPASAPAVTGFLGGSRSTPTAVDMRSGGVSLTGSSDSALGGGSIFVFRRSSDAIGWNNARLSFYSIGEAIDLAALDTRVSALMTALNTAIT